jgi:hypothetical protein
MMVQDLLARWTWKPIRLCPGRFVMVTEEKHLTVQTLLGGECGMHTFTSEGAKDPVVVVPLVDGGIISYARPDGTFVHTLNTSDGFIRKLDQLGIVLHP